MADRYYDRDDRERYGQDAGEFSGRGYDRHSDRNRDWNRRDENRYGGRDDRGLMERAGDEVRSWFGDDDAARRREIDDRRGGDRDRSYDYRGQQNWRDRNRDDWSSRDRSNAGSYGNSFGDENRNWNRTHGGGRDFGSRDWSGRDFTRGGESQWRTSGRGRDFGDDDQSSWLGRGPNWGRDFGWGNERQEGNQGLFGGEQSGRFGAATGRFAGRGPKGYQRSDERIREDVCDRLTMNPDVDATNIEVQVNGGEVTLRGTAESRYTRRAAEDIAEAIPGVKHVHNEIRVGQDSAGTGGAGGGLNAGAGGTASASTKVRS